jgi:hypothetical protein
MMRPIWMTRVGRVFKPPKCAECGCATEGGLYCDVCGYQLVQRLRDENLARVGPPPPI